MPRIYPILPEITIGAVTVTSGVVAIATGWVSVSGTVAVSSGRIEVSTGRVDAIPTRYDRISEYITTLSIPSGTTTTTGTISLPAGVRASEIRNVRAFLTGYTFTFTIRDADMYPIYQYANAAGTLVDNDMLLPVTGTIGLLVTTTTGVTGTTSVIVRLGVKQYIET